MDPRPAGLSGQTTGRSHTKQGQNVYRSEATDKKKSRLTAGQRDKTNYNKANISIDRKANRQEIEKKSDKDYICGKNHNYTTTFFLQCKEKKVVSE